MNNLAIHRIERTALLHCVRHRGRELYHAPSAGMVEGRRHQGACHASQGIVGAPQPPGSLDAAFFIPTLIVPTLLVTHVLIFWQLLRSKTPPRSGSLNVRLSINPMLLQVLRFSKPSDTSRDDCINGER